MKPVIPLVEPALLDLLEHFSSSSSSSSFSSSSSSLPIPPFPISDKTANLALVFRAVFGREIDVVEAGQLLPLLPSPLASRLVETTCAGLSCGVHGTYSRLATLKAVVKLALGRSVTSSELDHVVPLLPPSLFTHVEQYICSSKESYLEWFFIALSAAAIASLFVAALKCLMRCLYSRCTPTDVPLARTHVESLSSSLDASASGIDAFDSSDDSLATSDPGPADVDTTLTAALACPSSVLGPSLSVADVSLSTMGLEADEQSTAFTSIILPEEADVPEVCSMDALLSAEVVVQESKDDTSLTVSVMVRVVLKTRISPSATVAINTILNYRTVSPLPIPFLFNAAVNPAPLLGHALRLIDATIQPPRPVPSVLIHFGPEVDARAYSLLAKVDARPVAQPQQEEPASCKAPVFWAAHGRHDVYTTLNALPGAGVATTDDSVSDDEQFTTLAPATPLVPVVKAATRVDEESVVASVEDMAGVSALDVPLSPNFNLKLRGRSMVMVAINPRGTIMVRASLAADVTSLFDARVGHSLPELYLLWATVNPAPLLRYALRIGHTQIKCSVLPRRVHFGPEVDAEVRVPYEIDAKEVERSKLDNLMPDPVPCQPLVLWTQNGRIAISSHIPLDVLPATIFRVLYAIATTGRSSHELHAYIKATATSKNIRPEIARENTTKALVLWCPMRRRISDFPVPLRLETRHTLTAARAGVEMQSVVAPCQTVTVWSSKGCILPPTQSSARVPSYTTDLVGRAFASSLRDLHGFCLEVEEYESARNGSEVSVSDSRTAVVIWCPTRLTFKDLPATPQRQTWHALKAVRARPATQEDFLIELRPRLPKQPSPSSPSLPSIDVLVDTPSARRSTPGNSLKEQRRPRWGPIGVAGFTGAPGATVNPRAPVSHGHLRHRHPTRTSPAIPPSSLTMVRSDTAPLSSSPIKNDGKARSVVPNKFAGKAIGDRLNQPPSPLCSLDCNARARGPVVSERLVYPKPKPPALRRPPPVVFRAERRPADHQYLITDVRSDGSQAMRLDEAQPSRRRYWWASRGLDTEGSTEHRSRSMPHSAYANHETGEKRTSRTRR